MPVCAVLGGQWGDEGKGKIVDYLARDADIVARFNGGNNSGHTVVNDEGEFVLHLVPVGIFWPQSIGVIGNGVVLDPGALLEELAYLKKKGIDLTGRLIVSERCHLVMPYHVKLDELAEAEKSNQAIGTTGMGIGPAYTDKAARIGIRAAELLDIEALYPRIEAAMGFHNAVIEKVYDSCPIDLDDVFESCKDWSAQLAPFIRPIENVVYDAAEAGKMVILEGAQGAMLDLDHGTYPYVTSSNPTVGGASTGLGLPSNRIDAVLGVFKAYITRVGNGVFLTELLDGTGESIRHIANEYGTTTGRPRRIGWFDSVVARYSARINGYTSLVLTRLDVLDGFESLKICTGYATEDGEEVINFPGNVALTEQYKPIYEEFPGWDTPTAGVTCLRDLPKGARAYVDRIQELVGTPIDIISTGPHRDDTIMVRDIFHG